jgi:hypothetical protein
MKNNLLQPTLQVNNSAFQNQTAFAVGTGRCGTTFLHKVIAAEPQVDSFHMRHKFADAFQRYCTFNNLPIDSAGYFSLKENDIKKSLQLKKFCFESNPFLSLNIKELYDRMGSYFVLLVRDPEKVINSHIKKGWYAEPYVKKDQNKAVGIQYESNNSYHSFSRIAPFGQEFKTWNKYTQVGKLAWYWKTINKIVIEQFDSIPENKKEILNIEQLTYGQYASLLRMWGISITINKAKYNQIVQQKPNTLYPTRSVHDWTHQECEEFEAQVADLCGKFGYEWRTSKLKQVQKKVTTVPKSILFRQKIRKTFKI